MSNCAQLLQVGAEQVPNPAEPHKAQAKCLVSINAIWNQFLKKEEKQHSTMLLIPKFQNWTKRITWSMASKTSDQPTWARRNASKVIQEPSECHPHPKPWTESCLKGIQVIYFMQRTLRLQYHYISHNKLETGKTVQTGWVKQWPNEWNKCMTTGKILLALLLNGDLPLDK